MNINLKLLAKPAAVLALSTTAFACGSGATEAEQAVPTTVASLAFDETVTDTNIDDTNNTPTDDSTTDGNIFETIEEATEAANVPAPTVSSNEEFAQIMADSPRNPEITLEPGASIIEILEQGTGTTPQTGDDVNTEWVMMDIIRGEVADESANYGALIPITLGAGQLPQPVEEAITSAPAGSILRITFSANDFPVASFMDQTSTYEVTMRATN